MLCSAAGAAQHLPTTFTLLPTFTALTPSTHCLPHATRSYNWSQLTTVAWNEDPALLCAAHAAGARVVALARFDAAELLAANASAARRAWVAAQVQHARELHLDGLNFDFVSGCQTRR